MLRVKETKLQGNTTFISQVIGFQMHAIEKALRPFFKPDHKYLQGYSVHMTINILIYWHVLLLQ